MLLQYLIENLTTNEVIGTTNVEIGKQNMILKKQKKKMYLLQLRDTKKMEMIIQMRPLVMEQFV